MKKHTIKYIDNSALCITKKKYGKGYQYFEGENKITDDKLLKRIKSLVIPPMWTDVQICKWDDGHIQAIGRDKKGRKQYIYHSEWERKRQEEKFRKMAAFGRQLPEMRKAIDKHLYENEVWNKEKVQALVVAILDESGIRIGNVQYARKNGTYGLTTLRRKHLEVLGDKIVFSFTGKSNKQREVEIEDEELIRLIRKSAELPGYELFRYKSGYNNFQNIDSEDINDYIMNTMGEEFSSKDFRTWVATRYAIEFYPDALAQKEEAPRKKFGNILIRMVADALGNTPTVCKDYYVHPKIMQLIDKQELPDFTEISDDKEDWGLSASEKVMLQFI